MNFKNFSFLIAGVVLAGAGAVYAAAPSGGYAPNATLDPDCAPGDVDCFVSATSTGSAWNNADGSTADETGNINYTAGRVTLGAVAGAVGHFNVYSPAASGTPNIVLVDNSGGGNAAAVSAWKTGLGFWDSSGDAAAGVDPDMYIGMPGYVGIGTASPEAIFEVDDEGITYQIAGASAADGRGFVINVDSARTPAGWARGLTSTVDGVSTARFGIRGVGSTTNYAFISGDNTRASVNNADLVVRSDTGNVGIGGKVNPDAKLEVGGSIIVGDGGETCDGAVQGAIKYNAATNKHQGCDGTSWNDLY